MLWLGRNNEDVIFSSSCYSIEFFSAVSVTDIQTGDVNIRSSRGRCAGFLMETRVRVNVTGGPVENSFSFYLD